MSIKKISFITLLLASSSVFADASTSKFYGGLDIASASIENRAQETRNTLVSLLGGTTTVTQTVRNGAFRVFGGYKIIENADIELGYLQTQNFNITASGVTGAGFGTTAYNLSGSVKVSGFDYSVLLRPSISTGMNGLFVRVGGHQTTADVTASVSVGGTNVSANSKESGSGMLYGIGYDLNINQTLDVRVGITQYQKVAGISNNEATIYSIGLKGNF
jgi:hypothetical protein